MDFRNLRLKLDVKPVAVSPQAVPLPQLSAAKEWMHFVFNYHKDLEQMAANTDALESLKNWSVALSHARSIVDSVPG